MDPLSITLAATGLLGAVNKVISMCARYNEEMKKPPRDLQRFVEELRRLRDVLESLESLIHRAKCCDSLNPLLQALEPLHEPLTLYLQDVKAIQAKLHMPSWYDLASHRRRSFAVAVGWPLKEDEAKRELEKMKGFREQLKEAIQIDTVHIAVANQTLLSENQKLLTDLVKSWRSKNTVNRSRKVHRWLAAPDPAINYNAALEKRNGLTGAWFTNSRQYRNWMDNQNSFLWLYGIAGCGKTILTTTAIEDSIRHCEDNTNSAVAYFYFDFNDKEKQLYGKMVRSILKQLSVQSSETPRALDFLFSSCEHVDRQPTMKELVETLRQILHTFVDVYIIIDALDECTEREELLGVLEEFTSWNIRHLHVLISSRPERAIEEEMRHMAGDDQQIKVQSDVIHDDIRIYIRSRLDTDLKLRRWQKRPEVRNEIELTLMNKAEGMFRLVVCHLDELAKCFTRPQLQERLSHLPKTLDDMYSRILCSVSKEHEDTAQKVLQWLTFSSRSLGIEEIAETLTVDVHDNPRFDPEQRFADPRDILEICSGLVTTTVVGSRNSCEPERGEKMQLAHYSVKEFLVSERAQRTTSRHRIRDAEANTAIAEVCLGYLLSFDSPTSFNVGVHEEFPLAAYAAQYWFKHAKAAANGGLVTKLISELFECKTHAYLNWTALYNPDKPWQDLSKRRTSGGVKISPPSPPLYMASLCGLLETTASLLNSGVNVNDGTGECGNPLQAACRNGHEDIVELLLKAGADVNKTGGLYGTALQAASFWGHETIVQLLLDAGADVNITSGKYANPLHAASRGGYYQIVEKLLGFGAHVDAKGGFHGYPLQAAAFYGHEATVKCLLEAGADVNKQSGGIYDNALQATSRNGHDHIVQILLKAGARIEILGGVYHTALQSAARGAHGLVIKRLLFARADVNKQGGRYGNALQAACLMNNVQVVQLLLEAKANVNAFGNGEYGNALQSACAQGHDKVIKVLIDAGADARTTGGYHGYPILVAAENGHDSIVKHLLDANADVHGWKIRMVLSSPGHKRVAQLLTEAGADISTKGCGSELPQEGGSPDKFEIIATIVKGFEVINLTRDDIRKASVTIKFCDECGMSIPDGASYYHCGICLDDCWDSCEQCMKGGFPCRNKAHNMVMKRMKNGMSVNNKDEE